MLKSALFSKISYELIVQIRQNQCLLRGASVSLFSYFSLLRRLQVCPLTVSFGLILERSTFHPYVRHDKELSGLFGWAAFAPGWTGEWNGSDALEKIQGLWA